MAAACGCLGGAGALVPSSRGASVPGPGSARASCSRAGGCGIAVERGRGGVARPAASSGDPKDTGGGSLDISFMRGRVSAALGSGTSPTCTTLDALIACAEPFRIDLAVAGGGEGGAARCSAALCPTRSTDSTAAAALLDEIGADQCASAMVCSATERERNVGRLSRVKTVSLSGYRVRLAADRPG